MEKRYKSGTPTPSPKPRSSPVNFGMSPSSAWTLSGHWTVPSSTAQVFLSTQGSAVSILHVRTRLAASTLALLMPTQSTSSLLPLCAKSSSLPNIAKMGVSVLNADFRRLTRAFHLSPRGAFELNLLDHATNYPVAPGLTLVKFKGLADLVPKFMGLDHHKAMCDGASRFRGAIGPASVQYIQAAADAYAGYMLFHRMNRQRLSMDIVPPLPLYKRASQNQQKRAMAQVASTRREGRRYAQYTRR